MIGHMIAHIYFNIKFSMDSGEQCSVCLHLKHQLIMLACMHDPCLKCAAINHGDTANNKYYCTVCNEITELDSQSMQQIRKINENIKRSNGKYQSNTKRKQSIQRPTIRNNKFEISPSKYQEKTNRKINLDYDKNNFRLCKIHHEQEITYYCFECFDTICAECAIHGGHRNHEVILIKKAYEKVKVEYTVVIESGEDVEKIFKKSKEQNVKLIKDINERITRHKAHIIKQFETLKQAIITKQKQTIKEIEEIQNKNIGLLNTEIDMIDKQLCQVADLMNRIQKQANKEELIVLDEFEEKKEGFMKELKKYQEFSKINNTVPGIKGVNFRQIKQNLEQLKSLVANLSVGMLSEGDEQFLNSHKTSCILSSIDLNT